MPQYHKLSKGVEAMMRAVSALLAVALLFFLGCGQSKNDKSVDAAPSASAQSVQSAQDLPPATNSESKASSHAPHHIMAPVASAPAVAGPVNESPKTFQDAGASRNEDSGASSALLHPQQVGSPSRTTTSARSARAPKRKELVVGNIQPSQGESNPAITAPSASEGLPSISLQECTLFHNHRDGTAKLEPILYGTDRERVDRTPVYDKLWAGFCSSLTGSIVVTMGLGATAFFAARKTMLIVATLLSGAFSAFLGYPIVADLSVTRVLCEERKPGYGVGRGELELGICHVSTPPIHTPGEVERPSILSLDVIPNPERHFLLAEVEPLSQEPFFAELRRQVAASRKKDLFIFIHGYNVSFESAALRTAQMKTDLEFEGAACFYSWPSQGGLLQYTRDEENVRYTITHLRAFLNSITQQSGAKSIHLIAHSMGNRAVTDVLKELRLELGKENAKLFNQIILAAPDVDAQVFVKDLAPRIRDTADRVTLYASSNDRALIASKIVHGYPRAGESGRSLVVVDGIDTVDVTGVDCSLLGHSYYGDSASVLTDLALVLRGTKPDQERSWLTREQSSGLTFWRFSSEKFETAKRLAQKLR
jgi:esterase/lipase superfamily enzyme